jgi:hypothetical protein
LSIDFIKELFPLPISPIIAIFSRGFICIEKFFNGVFGTPHTVLIDKDGKKFSFTGALPYEELKSVIKGLDK